MVYLWHHFPFNHWDNNPHKKKTLNLFSDNYMFHHHTPFDWNSNFKCHHTAQISTQFSMLPCVFLISFTFLFLNIQNLTLLTQLLPPHRKKVIFFQKVQNKTQHSNLYKSTKISTKLVVWTILAMYISSYLTLLLPSNERLCMHLNRE